MGRAHIMVKILPSKVEMARAAVAASSDSPRGGQIEMSDLLWLNPADASRDIELHIRLGDADAGEIDFEIYSESGDGEIVYATGRAANFGSGRYGAGRRRVRCCPDSSPARRPYRSGDFAAAGVREAREL